MFLKSVVLIWLGITFFSNVTLGASLNIKLLGTQSTLQDLIVYLEPLDEIPLPTTTKTIEIDQRNKAFTPYISVMQLGNKVNFINQDDITHHIYSPIGDNKFEFKIRAGKQLLKADFQAAGEVAMGCNIHDWMSGYLLILDTPYFAKTNKKGEASLSVAQAGRYTLTVWHPQLTTPDHKISQTVNLTADQSITVNVEGKLTLLPVQKSDEDFDFLNDY